MHTSPPPGKIDWHAQPIETVFNNLTTTGLGLSDIDVEKRRLLHGFNCLPSMKRQSGLVRFLLQFNNILIYVLILAATVTILLQHWIDTLVIMVVIVVNALIGFIQEGRAEKALDAIRQILSLNAVVLRQGLRQTVVSETLVPGDIVILEAGDKVPADLRLFKAHGLVVDESILTGESVPVEKATHMVADDTVLADRVCMVYSGTLVTHGQGQGIVVATGANTEIGQISGLLSQVKVLTTPLVQQMNLFAKWLTIFILIIAIMVFVYGYFVLHHPFHELFMAVVGLSVAAIPEGLPAVLSITLAVGVQSMARRHAIIRRLPAIETLGAVSVICTDKTGTLTRNEMTVTTVASADKTFNIDGVGYAPVGAITLNQHSVTQQQYPLLTRLAQTAILCNDAVLFEHNDEWQISGDPMEGALLVAAEKIGLSVADERQKWSRTDTIPFDAKHRFMATLNHNHLGQGYIFVKGAPETLLNLCHQQYSARNEIELINTEYWQRYLENIAAQGQRVLALASKTVKPEQTVLAFSDVETGLVLLGMVGLIDPPREEAIVAVAQCLQAGIQVKMITGDHALTAAAIGKNIGLPHPDKIISGSELDKMSDAELASQVLTHDVFARTSPEHKLRLVMALQAHDMTVAMTGDGVNDALALKRADAGIAMGEKGNEVSKEAAELILTDDNFASIVAAIQEGRTVYDNLRKVISWTLPTNGGEAMTIIVALMLGLSLPITPIQILWINLITAVTLGLALAFEPTEAHTMQRPPRKRKQPLLTGALAWHIIFVSILCVVGVFGIYDYALGKGYSLDVARTMAVNTLVVFEIFHLFYIRNIYGTSLNWKAMAGTKIIWLNIFIIVAAQCAITYLAPLQKLFSTQALSFLDGCLILAIGAVFFALLEIEKQLRLLMNRAS